MKARISHPLSVFSLGAAFAIGAAITSAEASAVRALAPAAAGHAAPHIAELNTIRLVLRELAAHADERIATLKTELKITDAQLPQWSGFAEALRSASKSVESVRPEAAAKPVPIYGGERSYPDAGAVKTTAAAPKDDAPAPSGTAAPTALGGLPALIEDHEKRIEEHLANLKAIKTALDPLYATFSDEQKKVADQLIIGPFGVL